MRPAVDVQGFAGNKRRRFQIQHRVDDLLDLAHAPEGVQAGAERVRFGRVHGCLDDAGGLPIRNRLLGKNLFLRFKNSKVSLRKWVASNDTPAMTNTG